MAEEGRKAKLEAVLRSIKASSVLRPENAGTAGEKLEAAKVETVECRRKFA
jgi:hypothetical protein